MKRCVLGGARDVASFGERADIVFKPARMVFNERKGR